MHSSGTLQLDPARFGAGRRALTDRLADLTARRTEVGEAVDALLRGLRGEAADSFRVGWEEWRAAADEVIAGLGRQLSALAAVDADVVRSDDDAAVAAAGLRGRLG